MTPEQAAEIIELLHSMRTGMKFILFTTTLCGVQALMWIWVRNR